MYSISEGSGRLVGLGQLDDLTIGFIDLIDNTRCCSYKIQVILSLQTLLDDLKMKKSQEAAAETKSKGDRCLRFIIKGSIVELKLLQCVTEIAVLGTICRIKATINHRVYLLISRKRLCTGVVRIRYRVTHAGITDILDAGW